MNWAKAKSILIIALVLTNLILFGYNGYNYWILRDNTTTNSFIRKTEELLSRHGITVETKVPKRKNKLPSLAVEFETYGEKAINQRFFQGEGKITRPSSDRVEIRRGKEFINIVNSRRLLYENTDETPKYHLHSSEEAREVLGDFLLEHQIDNRDMELTQVSYDEDRYYFSYSKIYENTLLESSATNFVIDNRGVVSMDRLWLHVTERSRQEIYLSSAPRALLKLLERPETYGKTISKIEQCYYFNPEDQGYVEDITRAFQGRAIPGWKIEFKDGENIVIDNY